MKNPTPEIQDTPTCHRCGLNCINPTQNLTGWEGRQLAIERTRWYCADVEQCLSQRQAA